MNDGAHMGCNTCTRLVIYEHGRPSLWYSRGSAENRGVTGCRVIFHGETSGNCGPRTFGKKHRPRGKLIQKTCDALTNFLDMVCKSK